jgi:sugar (pentulose or hexulose) kinase
VRILGLDIGTSFLKGAVLDLDDLTVGEAVRRPLPAAIEGLPPRHVALEPSQLVAACADLLAALVDRAPDAVGLVVCSQMHGLVVTDDEGRALSPVITWQDQRALDLLPNSARSDYEIVTAALSESQLAALGNGMRAGRPLCTLYWMAQRHELPRHGVAVSLGDYVLAALAKQPPKDEATTAASMGRMDLGAGAGGCPAAARRLANRTCL